MNSVPTKEPLELGSAVLSVIRGWHGAMALYLTRYLNMLPARIPGDGDNRLDDLPADEGQNEATITMPTIATAMTVANAGWRERTGRRRSLRPHRQDGCLRGT